MVWLVSCETRLDNHELAWRDLLLWQLIEWTWPSWRQTTAHEKIVSEMETICTPNCNAWQWRWREVWNDSLQGDWNDDLTQERCTSGKVRCYHWDQCNWVRSLFFETGVFMLHMIFMTHLAKEFWVVCQNVYPGHWNEFSTDEVVHFNHGHDKSIDNPWNVSQSAYIA